MLVMGFVTWTNIFTYKRWFGYIGWLGWIVGGVGGLKAVNMCVQDRNVGTLGQGCRWCNGGLRSGFLEGGN